MSAVGTDMAGGGDVTEVTDGLVELGVERLERPPQAERPSSGRTENNNSFLFMAGLLAVSYKAGW